MARFQCQICGISSNSKIKQVSSGECEHEWEILLCEKTFIKWYWRCKFCGDYPGGPGGANGLFFPNNRKCLSKNRKNCVWERLIPDSPNYNDKKWICTKCEKSANQLKIGQAHTGFNVPGLGECFENRPNNHTWKRIQ